MRERKPVEVYPPGEFVKDELDARGWAQGDLAEILGRPARLVNELISGKRGITPETAKGLAKAFGTSAEFWMNLESAYQLHSNQSVHDVVERRALLFSKAPIRAMIRRSWIEASDNIEVLEDSVRSFFNVASIGDDFSFAPFAARKSGSRASLSLEQNAWLFRALQLSKAAPGGVYSKSKIPQVLAQLQPLLSDAAEIRKVPQVLAVNGIRFVVVEALPQSKIDGATFWLKNTPVVALSLRYDRIDYFWYTLMHELGHVKNEDGRENDNIAFDVDLEADRDKREGDYEYAADRFASEYLVSKVALDDFVARVRPLYSRSKIIGFANRMGVHPGLVVGQIHYRERNYSHFREFLVKVRDIITSAALSDGWGSPFPAPAFVEEA